MFYRRDMSNMIVRPFNPSELGFPPTLPVEIALHTAPLDRIKAAYNFTDDEWDALPHNPLFIKALTDAVEALKKDGVSFKMKAGLQADALLKKSWDMIHAHHDIVPSNVKADLIKFTIRCAGLEPDKGGGVNGGGNNLSIVIDLK